MGWDKSSIICLDSVYLSLSDSHVSDCFVLVIGK